MDNNGQEEEEKKTNNEIINELYNNYIYKYIKELDMIIITASFIRIWDKLHALNIKCPDTFNSQIRDSFYSFLNLISEIKKLNILNVEFNSLDNINFTKILGLINSNVNSIFKFLFICIIISKIS